MIFKTDFENLFFIEDKINVTKKVNRYLRVLRGLLGWNNVVVTKHSPGH